MLSLTVIVVVVANLSNAIHPAPGLLAFFAGGAGGLQARRSAASACSLLWFIVNDVIQVAL